MYEGLGVGYVDVSDLKDSFNNLPEDQYTPGGFRFRRLGVFEHTDGENYEQVGSYITQPAEINSYLGDVVREYSPIEDHVVAHPVFANMVDTFRKHTNYYGRFEVHQMRITAPGEPAPEGIHRDGYEHIFPVVVIAENITGGNLQAFTNEHKMLLNMKPMPNMYINFPDRKMKHFGTPIKLVDESKPGYWDVFVMSGEPDKE